MLTATIRRFIESLDHAEFAERERASSALADLGDRAIAHLEIAVTKELSAEATRRIESILQSTRGGTFRLNRDTARTLQAIAALERIATPRARAVIERVAASDPTARETMAARHSLERLNRLGAGR
jgi:hypothetical protein